MMRISVSQLTKVQQESKIQQGTARKSSWGDQLKAIQEQREKIKQSRMELIKDNEKQGGHMDLIEEQLKTYDQQLKNLDDQMQKILDNQAKEQREKLGKSDKETESDHEPKTREQAENEKMNRLSMLHAQVERTGQLETAEGKSEREMDVTDGTIRRDESNRREFIQRVKLDNPGAATYMSKVGASDQAYLSLAELKEKISTLSQSLGDHLTQLQGDIMEEVKEPNRTNPWEEVGDSDETKPVEADEKSELEKAYDLTNEFMDQYDQWIQETKGQQSDGTNGTDWILQRMAEWTAKLGEREDDSLRTWTSLVTPLDVRA